MDAMQSVSPLDKLKKLGQTVHASMHWNKGPCLVLDPKLQAALAQHPPLEKTNTAHDLQAACSILQAILPAAQFSVKDGKLQRKSFDAEDRSNLEEVMRCYLLELIKQALSNGETPLMAVASNLDGFAVVPRLLDLITLLCDVPLVDLTGQAVSAPALTTVADWHMYCRLCEECMEVATVQDSVALFSHMEHSRLAEVITPDAAAKNAKPSGPQLTVLRTCNSLLRRLSKTQDLQTCGRILIFIARIYPVTDKSGINLHGTINSGLPLPVDEVAPGAVDSSGEPIDAKLYATFWGLQHTFKNPSELFGAQSLLAKTVNDIRSVLADFETRKVMVKAGPTFTSTTSQEGVTARYLSSSKLFGLQLRDATFRRQFLMQCAALLHAVLRPNKGWDKAGQGKSSASAVLTVKPPELEELLNKVYTAMAATPDHGPEFEAAARHVLSRESHWVDWKNNNCKPFEELTPLHREQEEEGGKAGRGGKALPAGPGSPQQALVAAGDQEVVVGDQALGVKRKAKLHPAAARKRKATERLVTLSTIPGDQMAGLKAVERTVPCTDLLGNPSSKPLLPSFEEFVQPVFIGADPKSEIQPEDRPLRLEPVFGWKVVRMMSRTHLNQLKALNEVKEGSDLPKDIEAAVMRCFPDKEEQFKKTAEEMKAKKQAELEAAAAEEAAAAAAAALEAPAAADKEQEQGQEQEQGTASAEEAPATESAPVAEAAGS